MEKSEDVDKSPNKFKLFLSEFKATKLNASDPMLQKSKNIFLNTKH